MSERIVVLTSEQKTTVNNFMVNFKRANIDSEVSFVEARPANGYLKVTVNQNGRVDWYHVQNNGATWY